MDIEEYTLQNAGDDIIKCIKTFRDITHTVHELEEAVADIEHNEQVILEARSRVRNDPTLVDDIKKLLNEFRASTKIDTTRAELHHMYDKRRAISTAIKLAVSVTSDEPASHYMCPICFEKNVSRFISVCGHTFCAQCIDSHHRPTCPMCRAPYDITHVRNLMYSS